MRGSLTSIAIVITIGSLFGPATAASLRVCVKQIGKTDPDYRALFFHGPIHVPAGAVFDQGGIAFGPASDPLDEAHTIIGGGWTGISKKEADRRDHALSEEASHLDDASQAGLVTLTPMTLTLAKPCVIVSVAAAASQKWKWNVAPVFGSDQVYYQLYGVIYAGELDTKFPNNDDPLDWAGSTGALNGVLTGTADRVIDVPE